MRARLHWLDQRLHEGVLYPARRFLTLQHFTAIIMLLYAVALSTQPNIAFRSLATFLHFEPTSYIIGALFLFDGLALIGRPVSELNYRIATLPLFLYFAVILWYTATSQSATWTGAISSFAVWGFVQIARTDLPKGRDNDTDAGAN